MLIHLYDKRIVDLRPSAHIIPTPGPFKFAAVPFQRVRLKAISHPTCNLQSMLIVIHSLG